MIPRWKSSAKITNKEIYGIFLPRITKIGFISYIDISIDPTQKKLREKHFKQARKGMANLLQLIFEGIER